MSNTFGTPDYRVRILMVGTCYRFHNTVRPPSWRTEDVGDVEVRAGFQIPLHGLIEIVSRGTGRTSAYTLVHQKNGIRVLVKMIPCAQPWISIFHVSARIKI